MPATATKSLNQLVSELKTLRDQFEAALNDPETTESDEGLAKADALKAQIVEVQAQIDRTDKRDALKSGALADLDSFLKDPVRTVPHRTTSGEGHIANGESETDKIARTGCFQSAGHFYKAVYLDAIGDAHGDTLKELRRYREAVSTKAAVKVDVMSTLVDPSAGLLVPEGYTLAIEKRMIKTENLMSRARNTPIQGSSMTFFRRQDASRAAGSRHAGVVVKYEGEGDDYDRTKMKFEKFRIEADKMACLVELTEEQLTDSPLSLENEINDVASDAIIFKASDKMVSGTGAGTPLGVLNSAGTIVVTKENGQAAATVLHRNITKMWMRMDPDARAGAIWMINNDISDALDNMTFPVGTGGVPSYLPAGGLSQTGYASLYGRPVIPFEYCQTLGTKGDIILANWQFYRGVTKGGIRADMSLHVAFERDARVFRFVHRYGGRPQWEVPFTPANGSTTTGNFVVLETRA